MQVRLSPAEFSVCSCITDWTTNIADVCLPQRFNKQNSLSRYEYIIAAQTVDKPLDYINGVAGAEPPYRSSAICATASCSGFVWLTASILAWTRGGSPSNIAPSHGEGVWGFGKDAEIERPKALQDAKPTKRSYRDREFALFL